MIRSLLLKLCVALAAAVSVPASAQAQTGSGEYEPSASGAQLEYQPVEQAPPEPASARPGPSPSNTPPASTGAGAAAERASQAAGGGVAREDVFSAAEGVFGRGAEGLAQLIEDILSKQGQPNAYITGREAGGALVLGVRYGSGTLHHGIEGDRPVFWTGPSLGFDFGADANKVFVLVYNLYDSQNLFKRYPGAEGNAYVVGGFTASYLRRGDVVLIPIRMGVGVRLGVNAGYMRFSEKNRWLPV